MKMKRPSTFQKFYQPKVSNEKLSLFETQQCLQVKYQVTLRKAVSITYFIPFEFLALLRYFTCRGVYLCFLLECFERTEEDAHTKNELLHFRNFINRKFRLKNSRYLKHNNALQVKYQATLEKL